MGARRKPRVPQRREEGELAYETVWKAWCSGHISRFDHGFFPDHGTVCSVEGCEDPAILAVRMHKVAS